MKAKVQNIRAIDIAKTMRAKQTLLRLRLPAFRVVIAFWFAVAVLLAGGLVVRSGTAAAVGDACTPSGTTFGTDTMSVSIPSTTTYKIWARVQVPSVSSSSPLLLNIDNASGNSCYAVSGSAVTAANTWTWVDVTASLSTPPTLTQGNHSLLVTGTVSGASLDRIEFLNDTTCVPSSTGDNCTISTTPPTVSVTAPAGGSTVTGSVNLTATASATTSGATISKVQFVLDGTTNIGAADTTSPYSVSWDSTAVSNGAHTITAIATDSNNQPATSAAVNVTVNNPPKCTTATLAAPTGLAQDATTTTYTAVGMKWTAPTPTAGCTITGYNVYRSGGTTPVNGGTLITGTSYVDTGRTASTSYSYTVQAVDSGPNTSAKSASVNMSTTADNLAPNKPTGVGATSASPVAVSWTAPADNPNPGGVGVKGYNVYRCTGTGCTPSTATAPINGGTLVSGTTYSDTTVSASTTYGYAITAVDNNLNEGAPSTTTAYATTPAPTCSANPSQPGTPAAGATTDQTINFSWAKSTASAGCTLSGYHIYQVNGSTYTLVTGASITGTTTLTASIGSLTPNSSYVFAVEAFDSSGHTSDRTQAAAHITIATKPDTTLPTSPASLTASVVSSNQVSLTWPAGSDDVGVATYKIYRSDKPTTAITTVTATAATSYAYTDSTAAPSTTYTYQVSALDGAGNESNPKTSSNAVTTPAATGTTPSAPTGTQAPVVATQSAQLTWTAPSGTVTGYHIYIDGVLDTYSKDNFTATGGTLSCLAPSVTYTVTVKAFNSAGEGPGATVSVATTGGGLGADFDCSGHVTSPDLSTLARNWQKTSLLPTDGDANGDTKDNSADLSILARNWGK